MAGKPPKKSKAVMGAASAAGRKNPKNLVPMVMKTFEVLESFRERPQGFSYMELVDYHSSTSRVSIYRILCSLESLGYLIKDEQTNKYELSPKFIELGKITEKRQNILRLARPYLEEVSRQFGENVNLAKLQQGELIYLTTIEGTHPVRVMQMPSRREAVYCSSIGKAILAHLPEDERQDIMMGMTFKRLTPHTINSKAGLLTELERIKQSGWAIDNEENMLGVRCVGVPIFNPYGYPVAGMSVTGPASRISLDTVKGIGPELINVAVQISHLVFGS